MLTQNHVLHQIYDKNEFENVHVFLIHNSIWFTLSNSLNASLNSALSNSSIDRSIDPDPDDISDLWSLLVKLQYLSEKYVLYCFSF